MCRPLIAIDIGSSAIKMVEVKPRSLELKSIGIEATPAGAFNAGQIQDLGAIRDAVTGLLQKAKISTKGRRAAVSMSGSAVMIKRGTIKREKDSSFAEQVYYEAQQIFQTDMDDMFFRYQDLGPVADDDKDRNVVMVGVKRDLVDQHVALVKEAGLRIGVVDCDVLCLNNMFQVSYPNIDSLVMIVNIGASTTQVLIMENGQFLFQRELYFGGNEYTAQIASTMGIKPDKAEALKTSAGESDSLDPKLLSCLKKLNGNLAKEIRSTLDFFLQPDISGEEPRKISYAFLTGGGAKALGVDAAVAASLSIPVHLINPFQSVKVKGERFGLDYLLANGALYSVAIGLGIRQMEDELQGGR